jgi:hypothetical protein
MNDRHDESVASVSARLKKMVCLILIFTILAPSAGMAYVRCGPADSTGVGDGYCEGTSWRMPETEADIVPIRDNTYHEQPPGVSHGTFRSAYVDSRDGSAYEVEANLDTGGTVLYDASGEVVLQGQLNSAELTLFRDAAKRFRDGDPQAGTAIEAALVSLAAGLILVVVTSIFDELIAEEIEERACRRDMASDANRMVAEIASCRARGGEYVVTARPSMELCGGGAGYCK